MRSHQRVKVCLLFLFMLLAPLAWYAHASHLWGHHGTSYAAQTAGQMDHVGVGVQPKVTWLPSAGNSLNQYAEPQLNSLKSLVVSELLKENIISKTGRPFRQVKVKLMQQDGHPYALIFLYSNTMLSFSVARLDFDSNGTEVAQFRRHYRMQPSDFMPANNVAPICLDDQTDAIFMTPEYTGVIEGKSFKSWGNQRVNEIVNSIATNTNYNHPVFLLGAGPQGGKIGEISYLPATKSNFLNYMSCPHVKAFFYIGSEDNYPEIGRWAGTAFWTGDPTENPITSKDFQDLVNEGEGKNLQTIVLGGCHMFSNNTEDGMCPVITSQFKQLETYASTVTKIDIPAAYLIYQCYFNSDMSPQEMLTCAKQYDSYIKGNKSQKIYVENNSKKYDVLLDFNSTSGGHHVIKELLAGDFDFYDTSDQFQLKMIKDKPNGAHCKLLLTSSESSQGFYTIRDDNDSCKIGDIVNSLPLPERPTSNGLGVTLGVWKKNYSGENCIKPGGLCHSCAPVKTAFQVKVQPGSPCGSAKVTFTYQGMNKYKPIAEKDKTVSPSSIKELSMNEPQTGYFYTGKWYMSSTDLPSGCQLLAPLVDPPVRTINNDMSTDLTTACIRTKPSSGQGDGFGPCGFVNSSLK